MSRPTLFAGTVICIAVVTSAYCQRPRGKQQKKEDDLPEVALLIPEETRPEVKAIIKANVIGLASKRASERVKAAQVLGELREEGKPVRGLLCRAMLDPVADVRTSAADALKNIDPKIQYLAVTLVTEDSAAKRNDLMRRIQKLEEDGEPLTPLVAQIAINSALERSDVSLSTALTTLTHVTRADLNACKLVASALNHRSADVRHAAIEGLARMKHGRLTVPKIIVLLKTDDTSNRLAAIQTLTALADETTEEVVSEAIASLRYHKDEGVRRAVETALNKLQNKKNP